MSVADGRETIGIIAGGGQFPLLFCRAARARGYRVVITALEGQAGPELEGEADYLKWVKLGQAGKTISVLKKAGAHQAVMLGAVNKRSIFSGTIRPDLKMMSILAKRAHGHDDHLLRLFAEALEEEGITVKDSTAFLPELLMPEGQLSRRKPSKREAKDIDWGLDMAKQLGRFDIGQCIVVRSQTVMAVEAIEGTDATVLRGGELGHGRSVVIKVAKPQQDLRFDLPSVGLTTIRNMVQSGCTCLAVEAGRTLCFDREEMIKLADRNKIAVVAVKLDQD